MLTGKQRSYLKGLANNLDALFQIGKGGINDNFIKQLDEALETRELIKIKILNNNELDATETASNLCEELNAEFVQAIGKKFTIYRESKENKKIIIP